MLQSKTAYFSIFLILLLFTCYTFVTGESPIQKKFDINDSIVPFKIKVDVNAQYPENELKGIVKNQLAKVSGDPLNLKDIESVKYWGTYKLKDVNQVLIFKVKLSYDLPAVWHYSIVLIIDNATHNGYLIELDVIELIKIQQDSDVFYFAGRYKDRYRYGTFKIFEIKNNIMYDIFESDEAVSNYSYDCISYENDDLKLQNNDLNNDGYLDLKFTGIRNRYCNGYEQYGRDERKPIKSEKVTIIYYFDRTSLNWKKYPLMPVVCTKE